MSTRTHRTQKSEQIDLADTRSLRVTRIHADDRLRNPRDVDVDEAAIRNGVEHGGTVETRAEALHARGAGGRKRSQSTPHDRRRSGRDISTPRR
jgi:hypothetical protein